MSIEELATMLGEQLRAAEEAAWDQGYLARWHSERFERPDFDQRGVILHNPYRLKVSA